MTDTRMRARTAVTERNGFILLSFLFNGIRPADDRELDVKSKRNARLKVNRSGQEKYLTRLKDVSLKK